MINRTRREFLTDVGRGMVAAAVGSSAYASPDDGADRLTFGPLEPLVALMQETPTAKLLPALIGKLRTGTDLPTMLKAAALANARTFGGEDYIGFHTMMALAPAYQMSRELPPDRAPLALLKVLYRNSNRIQEFGGPASEVLRPVAATPPNKRSILFLVNGKETAAAEGAFAAIASPDEAFNRLLHVVQDKPEVHRVVLPYRAWEMAGIIGKEHAHTLLRQSLRYCLKFGQHKPIAVWDEPRTLLSKLLEGLEAPLKARPPADDAWVEKFSMTIFSSTAVQAAEAVAAALADGIDPDSIGEAIALAANQLLLRDVGRRPNEESPGKPIGSVHGDSIGVHACDSANAWRNMAKLSDDRNRKACLILGAYQAALDRVNRGGDFLNWQPLPLSQHLDRLPAKDEATLLGELKEAIRGNLQARAAALVGRLGALGHPARPVLDVLLGFAVSEDGALHAEKYYRTATDEFEAARPAFKWRHLVALARVTASECGRPAPGYAEAIDLLKT